MTLLVAALAGVLVLFAVSAPIVLRVNARIGQHSVIPSPSGGKAFVATDGYYAAGGGWLVDVATARKRDFVPPPVRGVAWSPDGSEVAVLTWSGPLGSVRGRERIDIRSAGDGTVVRSIPIAEESIVYALIWADAGLVAVVSTKTRQVEVVDPVTGAWRPTGFSSKDASVGLIGPEGDGRVFVRTTVLDEVADGRGIPQGYRLHPIDVAGARVGPVLADGSGVPITFAGWGGSLSPSGRFARIAVGGDGEFDEARLVDLRAAPEQAFVVSPPRLRWISGDRLVWLGDLDHRTRLFAGLPGAQPNVLREWRDAQVGILPSPDGRAAFVSVIPAGGSPPRDARRRPPDASLFEGSAPPGAAPEELVYLADEERFVPLAPPFSDRVNDQRYTQWTGPKTLARIAPGVVFFEDIDVPGKRRFVIGGPGDLE